MQAVKAYYSEGRFVPLGIGKLPEGTPAIITVLDEPARGVEEQLKAFDALVEEIHAAADEEMTEIERLRLNCEVEV